jgi:hypothetical protein
MKTTSLITSQTKGGKIKRSSAKQNAVSENAIHSDPVVNQLCEMVKAMLECQYQFMERFAPRHEQPASISMVTATPPVKKNSLVAMPANLPVKNEEPPVIMPLTYDKLKILSRYFTESCENPPLRTIGVHSHLNLLHTLYHLGGEAFPEQIFSNAGITDPSGFRYLSYLREIRLVSFKGGKRGFYVLTPAGRKFIEGEIKNKEQMNAALAEQKY